MTTQSTPHADVAADNGDYTIHSRLEIRHILRAVQHKNELVTAYFGQGNDFVLTSILDVDTQEDGTLLLDYGANDTLNKRLLESERIILVTAQDRVKVQFTVERIEKTEYMGRPAFRMALPDSLLKLQRREYYRLATPVVNPIKCAISGAGGGKIELVISDISLGGIAVMRYEHLIKLESGDRFADCHIVLPGAGTVSTGIEIRNQQETPTKSGTKVRRAGCMFTDIPATQQAAIQRYIIKLDRDRRALRAE